jgi:nitroreductase
MELYDVIGTTFTVREFTDDPLPDPVLYRIRDNARFAPTGGNRQGTHVAAVRAVPEEEQIRDILGIPDTHAVAALVPLGKPTRQLSKLRRRPIEELTTRDRFDGPSFRRHA